MKREVSTLVAILFFVPSSGLAQSNGSLAEAKPVKTIERLDFSAAAAGVGRIAAEEVGRTPRVRRAPSGERRAPDSQAPSRSFWRSPWPWVIGGGVIVVAVVANKSKSSDGSGY